MKLNNIKRKRIYTLTFKNQNNENVWSWYVSNASVQALILLPYPAVCRDAIVPFLLAVTRDHPFLSNVLPYFSRSALQTLHKVSGKAREQNYFLGGLSHDWVSYYEQRIESDRSCLNEWHAMDNLESKRPPSPDSVRTKWVETLIHYYSILPERDDYR